MAETVWQKLNLPESSTYIEMPLEFLGKKSGESLFKGLTGTAQLLLAEIHTQKRIFKHSAKITYEYLNSKYGASREPVARAIKELTDRKIIENVGQSRYEIIVDYNKKNRLKIDNYLFKHIFEVFDEQGNVVKRKRLTRTAIKALALVQRHYNNPNTSEKYISSQARIGAALNRPRTTAGDSVRELIAVSVFSCNKAENEHGDSKRGLYVYEVNPEIMAVQRKKDKAEPDEPTAADIAAAKKIFGADDGEYVQHIKPIDNNKKKKSIMAQGNLATEQIMRTKVEQHFYDLRHAAEERAESVRAHANADKEYKEMSGRLSALAREIAFAEIKDKEKAARLSEEQCKLQIDSDKRLAVLGINKAELSPQYTCRKCNDTGYDTRGKPCECLKKFIETIQI